MQTAEFLINRRRSLFDYLKNLQIFFFLILPISFVAGPAIIDWNISLIGILFIIITAKEKTLFNYLRNKIVIFFFIWCIYLILNSFLSNNIYLSLESSLFYFRFGFFSLGIYYILKSDLKYAKYFFIVFISIFFILIIDGFVQYFFNKNLIGFEKVGYRLGGLFREELILGSFLSRLLPLIFCCYFLLYKNNIKLHFIMSILLLLTNILVFLSGERSSFFYILIFNTIILIFINSFRKTILIIISSSIVFLFIFSFTDNVVKNRMFNQTFQQIDLFSEKITFFSPRHEAHYKSAFKIFIDNPIVGIGPKLFREECKKDKYYVKNACQTHPHHFYLQLLSETGLIGALPLIILFIWISTKFVFHLYQILFDKLKVTYNNSQICLYTCFIITLWPIIPTGNIFNNWLSAIMFLPVGFYLFLNQKNLIDGK